MHPLLLTALAIALTTFVSGLLIPLLGDRTQASAEERDRRMRDELGAWG